jgi:hypothetical protein
MKSFKWLLALAPLAIVGGCAVSNDKPDELLPVWYPEFVYRAPNHDANDTGMNDGPATICSADRNDPFADKDNASTDFNAPLPPTTPDSAYGGTDAAPGAADSGIGQSPATPMGNMPATQPSDVPTTQPTGG